MIRFKALIDEADKVRSFVKMVDSTSNFNKEYTVVTLSAQGINFFRTSDSVRVESMFELMIYSNESFSEYEFEMNEDPNARLGFDIFSKHLIEALSTQLRADSIKLALKMLDGSPVFRIKNPGSNVVQDIGIEFRQDIGPDDFRIPECIQESLTATIEASKLSNILTSLKGLEYKRVTIIADTNQGALILKAKIDNGMKADVKLRDANIRYSPPPGQNLNLIPHEMSVTVNLAPMQTFCRTIPYTAQNIDLEIVNETAVRLFVDRVEGRYTMYLCNIDVS